MTVENESEFQSDAESVLNLPSVKHDWYEKGFDEVVISIYIKNVDQRATDVEFKENEVRVRFKTGDEKFHKQYETPTDTMFYWCVKLSNPIIPEECFYSVKKTSMEIKMKKKKTGKWNSIMMPMLPGGARIASKEVQSAWNPALGQLRPADQPAENLPDAVSNAPSTNSSHSADVLADIQHTSHPVPAPTFDLGYTGLDNIGNTCFMNSVLQALANTRELRDYFLGQKYKADLNHQNPFGAGGRLAQAFYTLMKNLWSGELVTYNPTKLKSIVESRAPQFTGFMQHDAQEFMAFLLDGLHEEVNRIKVKPNCKMEERPGQPDHKVAMEAWKLHKSHNDSFIVDKFHGQYKSKLVCPNCGKESITFDPFLFLPVPLPKPTRKLSVVFFPRSSAPPMKMKLHIPKEGGVAADVLNLVAKRMQMSPENLRMFESYKSRIHKEFVPSSSMHSMADTDLLIVCEVLSESDACEPIFEFTVTQQLEFPQLVERCSKCQRSTNSETGIKIRRCTKCYRVGYCDQECQKQHWPVHKDECKKSPQLIGLPFVLSIEQSKATYQNLCHMISRIAKFSVSVTYKNQTDPLDDPDQVGAGDTGGDVKLGEIGAVGLGPAPGHSEGTVPFQLHLNYGSSSSKILQDEGDEVLCLKNVNRVALEWKNDPKCAESVSVSKKPLEFKEVQVNEGTSARDATKVEHCIQLFTEPEVLAAQEAWYCPRCKDHCQATKQLSLWQLPDILIIQLKRFSFKNMIWRDKIDRLVEFPVRGLDMRPFCITAESLDGPPIYDLFSVINHHGGIFGGHYTSYVRLPDKSDSTKSTIGWRLCDDNHVSRVHSEKEAITKSAYVMFYHKRKYFPSPKNVFPSTMYEDDEIDEELVECEEKDISFEKPFTSNCERERPCSLSHIGAAGGAPSDGPVYFPTSTVFDTPASDPPVLSEFETDGDPVLSSNEVTNDPCTSSSGLIKENEEPSADENLYHSHSGNEENLEPIKEDDLTMSNCSQDDLSYTDMDAVD